MAQDRTPRRTPNLPAARPPIRLSVPVDVPTHAKLCALAALRGVDRSELAAGFIVAGLRHVVITERGDAGREGEEAPSVPMMPTRAAL
jgi:hypothetical protein